MKKSVSMLSVTDLAATFLRLSRLGSRKGEVHMFSIHASIRGQSSAIIHQYPERPGPLRTAASGNLRRIILWALASVLIPMTAAQGINSMPVLTVQQLKAKVLATKQRCRSMSYTSRTRYYIAPAARHPLPKKPTITKTSQWKWTARQQYHRWTFLHAGPGAIMQATWAFDGQRTRAYEVFSPKAGEAQRITGTNVRGRVGSSGSPLSDELWPADMWSNANLNFYKATVTWVAAKQLYLLSMDFGTVRKLSLQQAWVDPAKGYLPVRYRTGNWTVTFGDWHTFAGGLLFPQRVTQQQPGYRMTSDIIGLRINNALRQADFVPVFPDGTLIQLTMAQSIRHDQRLIVTLNIMVVTAALVCLMVIIKGLWPWLTRAGTLPKPATGTPAAP